jgi:hypothetical protein
MARHDVRFNIPERKLGNSDIEFTVYSDDTRLGVLKISKGALVWRSANKKRGHIVAWDTFDRLAREHGRREPARPS